jgi:hypothetical protein
MEKISKRAYKTFSDLISEQEFNECIESMEEKEKLAFLRASLMYQRAIECRKCNSDVSIAFLCSTVEVVAGGKNITFKDWLILTRLNELSNKNQAHLEKELNKAYADFIDSEKNREGISYNFRKFLLTYCPTELRKPPIKVYNGKGDDFEIAVRAIYSNFRSLYLHAGIGYASVADKPYVDKETGEEVDIFAIPLLIKSGRKYISVELTKITSWFAEVVKKSMHQYLVS